VWRYSGIDAFDLDAFGPVQVVDAVSLGAEVTAARAMANALGPRAGLVVTYNGVVAAIEVSDSSPGEVLSVGGARHAHDAPADLGALAPGRDAFGELHDAFVPDLVVIQVARKAVVADPVVVVHLVDAAPVAGVSVFPRTLVTMGSSSEAGVLELTVDKGSLANELPARASVADVERRVFVVPVTELVVDDDASLRYANVQALGPGATSVAVQASRVGRDGTLHSFTAGLGGDYARVRTDSDLVGQGGRTALLAAYLGTGQQVHDFRTLQDHHAPRTESELLFKGAVADAARSVYSGLIRIRRGARGANAFQTNHNLVLSEGAHADSVPNLDIDENDVRCSHASTVGPVDEDQRYYLESRGIEPAVAERLVVSGFFSALAARAPFPGVGRLVEDSVVWRLARRFEGRAPEDDRAGGNRRRRVGSGG
jgi:Fe-S cluster assembly protein SufD